MSSRSCAIRSHDFFFKFIILEKPFNFNKMLLKNNFQPLSATHLNYFVNDNKDRNLNLRITDNFIFIKLSGIISDSVLDSNIIAHNKLFKIKRDFENSFPGLKLEIINNDKSWQIDHSKSNPALEVESAIDKLTFDSFILEDQILSDIKISYYPDLLLKKPTDNPVTCCAYCSSNTSLDYLFVIEKTVICNSCLPKFIYDIRKERITYLLSI